jgi:hypothetical protein
MPKQTKARKTSKPAKKAAPTADQELIDLVTEFLNDQELLKAPFRNEAICERARAVLARIKGTGGAKPQGCKIIIRVPHTVGGRIVWEDQPCQAKTPKGQDMCLLHGGQTQCPKK